MRAAPQTLEQLERRDTDSQASIAWGDPAIIVRCGFDPPPPSVNPCVRVTSDSDNLSIDWLALEPNGDDRERSVTYGRTPAVEVSIPTNTTAGPTGQALIDLLPAVSLTTDERSCY